MDIWVESLMAPQKSLIAPGIRTFCGMQRESMLPIRMVFAIFLFRQLDCNYSTCACQQFVLNRYGYGGNQGLQFFTVCSCLLRVFRINQSFAASIHVLMVHLSRWGSFPFGLFRWRFCFGSEHFLVHCTKLMELLFIREENDSFIFGQESRGQLCAVRTSQLQQFLSALERTGNDRVQCGNGTKWSLMLT